MSYPVKDDTPQVPYSLLNARTMGPLYLERNPIPTEEQIDKLQIDSYVKLTFVAPNRSTGDRNRERMWVKIKKINRSQYVGILSNHPKVIEELELGDVVHFNASHIIAVL